MSNRLNCPGLRADSVLAWLAAVGATVLDHRLRLHWTTDATPLAVLSSEDVAPLDALLDAWPDSASLNKMPIAREWGETETMTRHVQDESFRERAKMARGHGYAWTLSSTMTDLQVDKDGKVEHGPFDPPVPGGWTLHDRLLKLHKALAKLHKALAKPLREQLEDSLLGQADRVRGNGLGFDLARLGSLADTDRRWIDPVTEALAFFGLSLFPVRGDGVDVRLGRRLKKDRQRGWHPFGDSDKPTWRFVWPAWSQPLHSLGIDALLDSWRPARIGREAKLLGIHSGWRSVEYEGKSKKDISTMAYGSERLCRRD